MTVRLAHIGIAVRSIAEARNFYEEVLGLEVEEIEEIESEGVRVALMPFPGGEVELIEPLGKDTPVGRFLERHGEGLHHVSFDVPDVRGTIRAGIEHGVETVGEAPRLGAEGREIAFFHPLFTHGVLIEVAGPRPGDEPPAVEPEIDRLGRRLKVAFQDVWEREDLRATLRSLVDDVEGTAERLKESPAAARAKEGAREAGRKARGGLVESLRWLSGRLGELSERLQAEDDSTPAPPAS
jgi:methylmalonyl-CoA epimerase